MDKPGLESRLHYLHLEIVGYCKHINNIANAKNSSVALDGVNLSETMKYLRGKVIKLNKEIEHLNTTQPTE